MLFLVSIVGSIQVVIGQRALEEQEAYMEHQVVFSWITHIVTVIIYYLVFYILI